MGNRATQKEPDLKRVTSESRWIRELDHLLSVGMKHGRREMHETIKKVLRLATRSTRGDGLKRIRNLRGESRTLGVRPVGTPKQNRDTIRRLGIVLFAEGGALRGSGQVINRAQNVSFPIARLPAKDQWPFVQELFLTLFPAGGSFISRGRKKQRPNTDDLIGGGPAGLALDH